MTTDIPDPDPSVQSPRNAWINALRSEVARVGTKEMARVGHVGVWLASYADADGGSCFPGRPTLALLAGCTEESVSRLLRVLIGVGVLKKQRRPNKPTAYHLVFPLERPDWDAHMHHYTKTRQRDAHQRKKEQLGQEAARTASMDAFRTASMVGVPDSVHGGGTNSVPESPDSVHGRPRTASMDAFRTASMAGGDQYIPLPPAEDPPTDTTWFGPGPQPPVARASPPPLRLAASSPGMPGPASVQSPLLMSAPTEPPAAVPAGLPEPDTPNMGPLRCQDCGNPRGWRPDGIDLCHPCRTRQLDTG